LGPSIFVGAFMVVANTSTANVRMSGGTIVSNTLSEISGGLSGAQAITHQPTLLLGVGKSVQVASSTVSIRVLAGTLYIDDTKLASNGVSSINAILYNPTLLLDYTVFANTISATGRTYRGRVNPGQGGINGEVTSSSLITDSIPSLKKGIVNASGIGPAIVTAGQIGLDGGDILINLGNGQWRKR
jgi:hypothetical protein